MKLVDHIRGHKQRKMMMMITKVDTGGIGEEGTWAEQQEKEEGGEENDEGAALRKASY